VALTVTPVNDAPVAIGDSFTTLPGTPLVQWLVDTANRCKSIGQDASWVSDVLLELTKPDPNENFSVRPRGRSGC
jgi:hypothetical protein